MARVHDAAVPYGVEVGVAAKELYGDPVAAKVGEVPHVHWLVHVADGVDEYF